jgi:uncharacterized protein YqjF (DUF2071 family)
MAIPSDALRLAERERPKAHPVMFQKWQRLLFLHWVWDAAAIQRTLPPGLTVDTYDGKAWIGIVPFFMRGIRPVYLPAVPGISNFLELNVRTYVYDSQGKPGVWFYSLDANQWLAVKLARSSFFLPYEHATMSAECRPDGFIDYRMTRHSGKEQSRFVFRPAAGAQPIEAVPGTLEFFLFERYALFSCDPSSKQIFSGRVSHVPYRISPAEVQAWDDVPLRLDGLGTVSGPPACAWYSDGVDVEVFRLAAVPELSATGQPAGAV